MKRSFSFFAVVFFTLSLFLAFSAMAQTVTLESSTGDRIGGGSIKAFSFAPDGSLIVYLNGPFTLTSLLPDITVDDTSGVNCVVTKPASVTATQGANLSFKITSATLGATFSPIVVNPEPGVASFDPNTKTFTWNTGGNPPQATGPYLAVFQAQTTSPSNTSQLVVTIKINPAENVSAPTTMSGPTSGAIGQTLTFTASGSTSDLGHALEYQFDWGDGTQSGWSTSAQSHSWGTANTYNIKAQARCIADQVVSAWSSTYAVAITNAPSPSTYTLTVNVSPTGGGTVTVGGTTYSSPITGLSGSQLLYITATPNTGGSYQFSSWTVVSGGAAIGSSGSASTTVTMNNASATITANFSSTVSTSCANLGDSCAQQLGSAVPVNFPVCTTLDKGAYGYMKSTVSTCNSSEVTVPAGGTTWFLVDGSQVQFSGGYLRITIADYNQGNTGGRIQASIYPIDSNNNFVSVGLKGVRYPITPVGDNYQYSTVTLPTSYRYLVKVGETGAGVPISVFFNR